MEEQDIQLGIAAHDMTMRASVSNIDKEKRTFDMVLATETPVPVFDYKRWKVVDQTLTMTKSAADLSRIKGSGVGFFEVHPSLVGPGRSNRIGIIENVRFQDKQCIASVRMSTRPNDDRLEQIWHDIRDGIQTSVSIGFGIREATIKQAPEGSSQRDMVTVTKWELMEGSLADIAAAPDTSIQRSAAMPADFKMPENIMEVRCAVTRTDESEAVNTEPQAIAEADKTRSTIPTMEPETEAQRTAAAEQMRTATNQAVAQERTRVTEITTLCRDHAVEAARMDAFIKDGKTVDEVRTAILADLVSADPNAGARSGTKVVSDPTEGLATRMADGILLRAGAITDADMQPAQVEAARDFRNTDMIRIAEQYLQAHGVRTVGWSGMEIAKAALGFGDHAIRSGGGGMLITDFPTALGSAMNRILLKRYEMATQSWRVFSSYRNAKDFRAMTSVQMGDAPRLELVVQGGEIRKGFLKDLGESYAISAYGKIVSLDWRAFINDDLGVFNDLPAAMAEEVSQLQSDIIYEMLLSNPTLSTDGLPVFHATHGNIGTAAALSATSLEAAEVRFMKQTSIGSPGVAGRPLNLRPELLIVGPLNYHKADALINPTGVILTTGSQQYKGKYEIVVDARITDASFYLGVRPGRVKMIEYALLEGKNFWTDKEKDFSTSGWNYKIETAFGAKFLDFRGFDYTPSL